MTRTNAERLTHRGLAAVARQTECSNSKKAPSPTINESAMPSDSAKCAHATRANGVMVSLVAAQPAVLPSFDYRRWLGHVSGCSLTHRFALCHRVSTTIQSSLFCLRPSRLAQRCGRRKLNEQN